MYLNKLIYYKIMDKRFYNIYNNNEHLETKKLGEVYTPENIVGNMIDKIPEKAWNNKNIKVLDFACGTGIFAFFIYKKLIRYFNHDYIVNNILYFNDIQEKNINKIKYIFNNPLNIHHGNFLEWDCDIKFDIIIGNPPFSNLSTERSNGNTCWSKFVDKLLTLLKDSGYLSLIHPPGWRKPSTKGCKYTHLYTELTQKRQMHYLEIYNTKDGKDIFRCGTRFDIYLVENVKPYKNTIIIDEKNHTHKVNLLKWPFIPNHSFKLMSNLLKCEGENITIIYNRNNYGADKKHVSKIKSEIHKYTLIHTTTKNGINYRYSTRNDLGHFGVSKLIWCITNFTNNIIDVEGNYGMTQSSLAIKIKDLDEGEIIRKCFLTKRFAKFMDSIKYGNYDYEFRVFSYLKNGIWEYFLQYI